MSKNKNLVFVHTIFRPGSSANGLENFTDPNSGVKLKKNKIGRCTDTISALYSARIGGLANYVSYTPYVDPKTGVTKVDENGEPIMIQAVLEKKWGKPAGYFTNMPWVSGEKIEEGKLSYFQRKSWQLQDGCTVFDLNQMDDEMGYYMMLASKYVANSETEYRQHKWPEAKYYIAIENESDGIKYQRAFVKAKAVGMLSSELLTDIAKRKLVALLDIATATTSEKMTPEQVFNALFNYIEASSYTAGSNIEKFNNITSMLSLKDGREKFEAMYILKKAIDSKVIYERQGTYTFKRDAGNVVIGDSYDEALEYIMSPKRGPEVEEIQALSKK